MSGERLSYALPVPQPIMWCFACVGLMKAKPWLMPDQSPLLLGSLTTNNPGILRMTTVLIPPCVTWAVLQAVFATFAHHLVHPDWTWTPTVFVHAFAGEVTKTSTDDYGVRIIPTIITNGSPLAVMKDFHTALINHVTARQTNSARWRYVVVFSFQQISWYASQQQSDT